MKQKIYFLIAVMLTAMMVNLTSCKDEDDGFEGEWPVDWSYYFEGENATIWVDCFPETNTSHFRISALEGAVLQDSVFTISSSYSLASLIYDIEYGVIGGEMKRDQNVTKPTITLDKPFENYVLKIVAREKTATLSQPSDTITYKFSYIPRLQFVFSRKFGKGESSTTIKWQLNRLAYAMPIPDSWVWDTNVYQKIIETGNNLYCSIPVSDEILNKLKYTVEITSNDVVCDVKPEEIAGTTDSVYLKKDVDKGIMLTQSTIYADMDGKERYAYEEAYKYKIKVTAKFNVGNHEVQHADSISSIIVDADKYAIDNELNIYSTLQIGDDVWTIDNYRGSDKQTDSWYEVYPEESISYYFYVYADENKYNNRMLNGYHIATENDWRNLEEYLGIEYASEYSEGIDWHTFHAIFKPEGDIFEIQSKNYLSTSCPWHVFSDDPFEYTNSEELEKYPFSFNVIYSRVKYNGNRYTDAAAYHAAGGLSRVISKAHKGFCKQFGLDNEHIRFVKDK